MRAALLVGPTPITFNSADVASTNFSISTIPSSAAAGALALLETDKQASALSNSLKVATITYKNIQDSGTLHKYDMDLEVAFTGGVRALRPLRLKMKLNTVDDVVPGVQKVTGCNSAGGMTADICTSFDGGVYNAATGKCSGVGGSSGMTATVCSSLSGIYDAVNNTCTETGVQEYNSTTCPAPKIMIAGYWPAKICVGSGSHTTGGFTCATAGGWFGGAPASCSYTACGSSNYAQNGPHIPSTCTAPAQSKVRCL